MFKTIPLKWNSRTPKALTFLDDGSEKDGSVIDVKDEPELNEILNFLSGKGREEAFILGFYCYGDNESMAVREKLKEYYGDFMENRRAADGGNMSPPTIKWLDLEIDFDADIGSELHPYTILEKIDRFIRDGRFCVVTLMEHIYFSRCYPEYSEKKMEFQGKIAGAFADKNACLLLFGNLPYEIHFLSDTSPLTKFVKVMYRVPDYEKFHLRFMEGVRAELLETIHAGSGGHLEIVAALEEFWADVALDSRVGQLVRRFLDIPLKG